MSHYLDLENWSRKELFNFFIGYSNPYFNICTQMDVTKLHEYVSHRPGVKISAAIHYFALRAANEVEQFRYRLKNDGVFVYDVIHGGTTVLMPNESFAYAYFDYQPDFEEFTRNMSKSVEDVRNGDGHLRPTMRDDVIYHTTLPWISFTSFSHARTGGRGESIPRLVFGKFTRENNRLLMPLSVEVHHALVDGIHVGEFLSILEAALADPEAFVRV
jgi:chloramphenicol O-acetyltransferase type A